MSRVIRKFTTRVPQWRPHVTPVDLDTATDEQRDALSETPSNTKISDYVLVLAHDPQALGARTPLFNGIMYDEGGLSRAERELGAVAASFVNRCIYCAAVHASRYNKLKGEESTMQKVFFDGEKADLPPREAAILKFGVRLSQCPPEITPKDIDTLREQGLNELAILDLTLSTALFGWANRLMHTLGEPVDNRI
ncbi:peroxidase-related enzyme [Roseinatronobacter alkalisoli]|uniref:Peroxidase-related enzyme n=1 Tax=Roseinatronobacter alkalisoli TaxID=3028235 RepID=A0ABT5TB58_9RHOB|nr:peroxidase-related enzyme [Roseinatronobacter sp. HJB301]MDD7972356.1 peroxidase-related enzyme [Roseinatronobacter sp. HJB301]